MMLALAAWPVCATPGDIAPAALATASSPTVAEAADSAATLMVFNRPIVQFRLALPGVAPAERARRAHDEVARVLQAGGPGKVSASELAPGTFQAGSPGKVSTSELAPGTFVLIDEIGVFPLLPGDLAARQTVDDVVGALQQAVQESREARSLSLMLRAAGFALLATLVCAGGVWLLRRLRFWLGKALVSLGHRHSRRLALGGTTLISRDRVFTLARTITAIVFYALLLILIGEWLGFVLRQFPYTRRWGEDLNNSGLELASQLLAAIAGALPGLAVAVVIFFIARGVLGLTTPFFAQVERGDLNLTWIDKYTVRATRKLVNIGIWLFALAMAYPYLPGAESEAFRGISVLLGLMLTIGSSNLVGQGISGLILTYATP